MRQLPCFFLLVATLFSCQPAPLPEIGNCRTFACLDSLTADTVRYQWNVYSRSPDTGLILRGRDRLDIGFPWTACRIDSLLPQGSDSSEIKYFISDTNSIPVWADFILRLNEEGKIVAIRGGRLISISSFYMDESEVTGIEYQDTAFRMSDTRSIMIRKGDSADPL
jgi:hypothetical protein